MNVNGKRVFIMAQTMHFEKILRRHFFFERVNSKINFVSMWDMMIDEECIN